LSILAVKLLIIIIIIIIIIITHIVQALPITFKVSQVFEALKFVRVIN